MPATSLETSPLTSDERNKRRALRDRAIEAADLPDSTRLLLQIQAQHGDDELDGNQRGHAGTAQAIHLQTKVLAGVATLFFVAFVYLVSGFMDLAGVDLDRAARATQGVTHAAGVSAEEPAK